MRVKAIAGVAAIWLSGAMFATSGSTTEFAVSRDSLGLVLSNLAMLLSGIWLVVRGEALPEDTGQTLVPRRWVWYAISAFFALVAAIYTGTLLVRLIS